MVWYAFIYNIYEISCSNAIEPLETVTYGRHYVCVCVCVLCHTSTVHDTEIEVFSQKLKVGSRIRSSEHE
jgi:hypothetical protein